MKTRFLFALLIVIMLVACGPEQPPKSTQLTLPAAGSPGSIALAEVTVVPTFVPTESTGTPSARPAPIAPTTSKSDSSNAGFTVKEVVYKTPRGWVDMGGKKVEGPVDPRIPSISVSINMGTKVVLLGEEVRVIDAEAGMVGIQVQGGKIIEATKMPLLGIDDGFSVWEVSTPNVSKYFWKDGVYGRHIRIKYFFVPK